jgi:hypothetical protein
MIEQVDPETGTEGLMQIGGVGSGHDTYSHQVTGCIHEHGENKDVGGAGTKLGSVQTAEEVLQENSSVNFMSWVQNISSKGKQFLQKIWGESKEANDAITSQNGSGNHIAGQETLVTGNSVGVKTTMNRAAVETAATHTYFRPVEAKDAMPANPLQKVRYQVQKVARKLMDRLPSRFLGSHTGDFLQTKQQQTKEDLRKRSQYKQDDQEIECILTDESYLTDSYNRKGEYSHLTTDK